MQTVLTELCFSSSACFYLRRLTNAFFIFLSLCSSLILCSWMFCVFYWTTGGVPSPPSVWASRSHYNRHLFPAVVHPETSCKVALRLQVHIFEWNDPLSWTWLYLTGNADKKILAAQGPLLKSIIFYFFSLFCYLLNWLSWHWLFFFAFTLNAILKASLFFFKRVSPLKFCF